MPNEVILSHLWAEPYAGHERISMSETNRKGQISKASWDFGRDSGDNEQWIHCACWLACFDILGFKKMVSFDSSGSMQALYIMRYYEETLKHLSTVCEKHKAGDIDYCWLSDTFVMFTCDDSARAYTVVQFAAKYFMDKCLSTCIPLRGAISVGPFTRSRDNRAFMGKAFIEAFQYAEDQDWIGLILTPTAIKMIESYGLNLIYDFVASDRIPMRKYNPKEVRAYRFQNGAANYPCPLLPGLRSMRLQSEEVYRSKYERTEKFIEEHYSWLE